MSETLKLTAHAIISTATFVLLAIWLVTDYKPDNTSLLENIAIMQAIIFLLSFILINYKHLKLLFKIHNNNTKDTNVTTAYPNAKDIFFIFLAIIGALMFAYIISVYEIDLMYYVTIFGILLIWLVHLFYAFKLYKFSKK